MARPPAAVLLAGGLLTAVTGCAKFDAALGKQEAVVQFKNGTHEHHPAARPGGLLAHTSGRARSAADRSQGLRPSV